MKVGKRGDAMGRPSCRSSILERPSARFLGSRGEIFHFWLFLPGGAAGSGPQRSRARGCRRGASGPLTARTAARASVREEKNSAQQRTLSVGGQP